jgi:Na+-transporting methylmalonyl-CoA/oxaloacetate decarboxylase gamma subunit
MFEVLMVLIFATVGFSQMIPQKTKMAKRKARKEVSPRATERQSHKTNQSQFISALTFSKPRL